MEALMNKLMIDTVEGRDTEMFDVPCAYNLHVEITKDKRIIMKLRGKFVNIMCESNSKFNKNIC